MFFHEKDNIGTSWEGFAVENIIRHLDDRWQYSYYRTSGQAEIDLVLETPNQETWAIEVKRGAAPQPARGFYEGCEDIQAAKKWRPEAVSSSHDG